ncbi:hypothetical protein IIA95_03190 [Patescibacteria group bacterium]|nr:hypothetical protein [Patescibacteria group bacterium]
MKLEIKKISLGLRHRRTFRISEIAGSVIDYIVHDNASPFNLDYYKKTNAILDNFGENKGRILLDERGDNSLVVDIDSVILNLTTEVIDDTLKEIKEKYLPYITKNIHKKFEIKNFNRLGIVYEYEITGEPNHLISRLTNSTFFNAQTGLFRFSTKEIEQKSQIMQKLLDYKNYLIAIGFDEDTLKAKFDYQFYFQPEIGSTGDIDFDRFIDESKNKLETKFLSWLNNEEQK